MLYTLLTRLFGHINLHEFLIFHHYLRKTGHCRRLWHVEPAAAARLAGTFGRVRSLLLRAALLSWLGTAFVATMDEWHQSYIPSRTGTWKDVVLDSVAGVRFCWSRIGGCDDRPLPNKPPDNQANFPSGYTRVRLQTVTRRVLSFSFLDSFLTDHRSVRIARYGLTFIH